MLGIRQRLARELGTKQPLLRWRIVRLVLTFHRTGRGLGGSLVAGTFAKTSMTARETMQANWNEPKFGFVTRPASPRDLHAIAVGPRTEVVCSGSLDDVP